MHQRQLVYALIGSCLCIIRKLLEERNRFYICLVLTKEGSRIKWIVNHTG